jgi:DNA-binding IclR family transcriptional regulator
MAETVSISKSVARAFQVLELFRTERRPLVAADIGRRLALPQPSVRALLKTLAGAGYLAYSNEDRTYQPTARVAALGQWLPARQPLPSALVRAVDAIARLAEETASLCVLREGDVEILHVRKAGHPVALQLEPGVGVAAWRSAVGRALLAALPEAESDGLVEDWLHRERTAAGRRALQSLPRELKRARRDGFVAAYGVFLAGVGAVCLAVPSARLGNLPGPVVVAVAGLSGRIRSREAALVRMLRGELRRTV